MSLFFQRVVLFLFIVVLERSFIGVLWPEIGTPVIVISLIAALVFALGFERGLFWSLLAVLCYEVLGAGGLSWFPLYAVGVAYLTSFLSRRFLIEHHSQGVLMLACEVAALSLGYSFFISLLYAEPLAWGPVFLTILASFLSFLILFPLVQWYERRIEMGQMTEFRGLRT